MYNLPSFSAFKSEASDTDKTRALAGAVHDKLTRGGTGFSWVLTCVFTPKGTQEKELVSAGCRHVMCVHT